MSRLASKNVDHTGQSYKGEVDYYGQPIKKQSAVRTSLDELTRKNTLNNSMLGAKNQEEK